jgi:hypothetical protein
MPVTFNAVVFAVGRDEDHDYDFAAFADRPDGSGRTLEIQRALEFDAQDVELGMDTYCLVLDASVVHYGGVVAWQLAGGRMVLSLDRAAEAEMGSAHLVVALPAGAEDAVSEMLPRLLAQPSPSA